MRRCRAQNQNEDDAHDLARFEAEARAVRATLQRMSMVRNSFMGDGMNDRYDPNLQHRKEFLDNALLTKVRPFRVDLVSAYQHALFLTLIYHVRHQIESNISVQAG